MKKTLIKNLVAILLLDLVALPLAAVLYVTHGFNIVHVIFAMAYLYGFALVYKTVTMLTIQTIMNDEIIQDSDDADDFDDVARASAENYYDSHDETLKPEMKQAMDDVFELKKH